VAATRVSPGRVSAGMPILMPTSCYFVGTDLTRLSKKGTTVLFLRFLLVVKDKVRVPLRQMLLCVIQAADKSGSTVKWRPL
jgi:hypothetical protein